MKRTKISAMLLALVMALSLAACGGNNGASSGSASAPGDGTYTRESIPLPR